MLSQSFGDAVASNDGKITIKYTFYYIKSISIKYHIITSLS